MLTRLVTLLSIIFVLVTQSAFASTKALTRIESEGVLSENENYAIVIGVDEYDVVAPLNYAASDAQSLGDFFDSQGYQVTTLLNTQASKARVLSKLRTVAAVAGSAQKAKGNIIFLYSGHGFQENGVNYLAPSEIDPKRLTETGISLAEVSQILESANVRQRALFIDACRNDPSKSFASDSQRFTVDASSEGLAILYSTGAGNVSYEDTDIEAGVFSHYLLKGFEGEAAAEDGLVSFNGVSSYVRNQVKKHVLGKYSKAQVPYMAGERSGEFVLARADMVDGSESEGIFELTQLTVNRQPPGALVEFVGRELQYSDGIELDANQQYDIKVSHLGYDSFNTLYKPEGGVQTLDVVLSQAVTAAPPTNAPLPEEKGGFLLADAKEPKKSSVWKVVGGVVVVALIAGLAGGGDSGGGSSSSAGDEADSGSTVGLTIQVQN